MAQRPTSRQATSERVDHERGVDRLRGRVLRLVLAAAAVVAGLFACFHMWQGQSTRAVAAGSTVLVALGLTLALRNPNTTRAALAAGLAYAGTMTLGLLASPAFPPGDFVWCLLLPPLITYMGGRKVARWLLPVLFLAAAAIVLRPDFARHELWQQWELASRFLGVLLLMSLVAWFYERARSIAHQRLQDEITERRTAEGNLETANRRLQEAVSEAAGLAHQAQAASAAKSLFLSQMSHDIRTPLTGVVGMASLLERSQLNDKQRRQVEVIRASGEALSDLIGDVLDLARIEAGTVELQLVPMLPTAFAQDIRLILTPQAEAKGLQLDFQVDPELPQSLLADPTRLRQVALNLVGNALRFTDAGTVRVTLALRPDGAGKWWRLQVEDTGIGIPAAERKRIFDRFTQAAGPGESRRGGSGLGLAICSHLVALLGGELGLRSEVGVGSTFWTDLPLRLPTDAPGQAPAAALPELGELRLLVVDDSEIVRKVLCGLLRQHGHEVDDTADASAALARLSRLDYDAVLIDVQMPEIDGIEAARIIRRGEGGVRDPGVAIIAVTALADADTRAQCLGAGFNDVVSKPVTGDALLRALAASRRAADGEMRGATDKLHSDDSQVVEGRDD